MARQSRRFTGRSTRSPTNWAGFETVGTVPAVSTTIVGSFVPTATGPHETVIRLVGSWQADGPGDTGNVVLGGVVVSDAAFAIGITALPDPITEISDDMWTFVTSVSVSAVRSVQDPMQFDSYGMRKIEEGQTLAIVIANSTDGIINWTVYMRGLFKSSVRS